MRPGPAVSPSIQRQRGFRLSNGEVTDLITLRNRRGTTATVSTFGATLVSLRVPDARGTIEDVVLGFDELTSYESNRPYFGSTIGRFANRIRAGRFELDGAVCQVAINSGAHHLHGGQSGFSHRIWQAHEAPDIDDAAVLLTLESPDGEEGYPGRLEVAVTYRLDETDRLHIDYRAAADAPTHVNLTHHSYFNLRGRGDVLDHTLQLRASRYTPVDEARIPTGSIAEVTGTPMDFRGGKALGTDIGADYPQLRLAGGYDHNFVIDGWDGSLREIGRLHDPASGRSMAVATTCPGVQLYTANSLFDVPARGGGTYGPRAGVCLETQFFPDTPNHPHFPTTRVAPGNVWRHRTTFDFSGTELTAVAAER